MWLAMFQGNGMVKVKTRRGREGSKEQKTGGSLGVCASQKSQTLNV
jgi:hypothetical protein